MPNKILNQLWAVGVKNVIVPMRFFPQGTTQLTKANQLGRGYSVSRTGVGTFTITLDSRYRAFLAVLGPSVQQVTAAQRASVGALDPVAGTINITVANLSDGNAADLTANANTSVSLLAIMSDTSITGE